jgi:hypothetical protein
MDCCIPSGIPKHATPRLTHLRTALLICAIIQIFLGFYSILASPDEAMIILIGELILL